MIHRQEYRHGSAIEAGRTRQDTFLRISDLVADQLGMIGGLLLTSYLETAVEVGDLWTRTTRGESQAFSLEIVHHPNSSLRQDSEWLPFDLW